MGLKKSIRDYLMQICKCYELPSEKRLSVDGGRRRGVEKLSLKAFMQVVVGVGLGSHFQLLLYI